MASGQWETGKHPGVAGLGPLLVWQRAMQQAMRLQLAWFEEMQRLWTTPIQGIQGDVRPEARDQG